LIIEDIVDGTAGQAIVSKTTFVILPGIFAPAKVKFTSLVTFDVPSPDAADNLREYIIGFCIAEWQAVRDLFISDSDFQAIAAYVRANTCSCSYEAGSSALPVPATRVKCGSVDSVDLP